MSKSLLRFDTGEGWQRYLLLTDQSESEGPLTGAVWSDEEIEQVLDRFELVSGNPQFDVISHLQNFQETHKSLASYVRQLNRQNGEADSLPPAEELPLPED